MLLPSPSSYLLGLVGCDHLGNGEGVGVVGCPLAVTIPVVEGEGRLGDHLAGCGGDCLASTDGHVDGAEVRALGVEVCPYVGQVAAWLDADVNLGGLDVGTSVRRLDGTHVDLLSWVKLLFFFFFEKRYQAPAEIPWAPG